MLILGESDGTHKQRGVTDQTKTQGRKKTLKLVKHILYYPIWTFINHNRFQ